MDADVHTPSMAQPDVRESDISAAAAVWLPAPNVFLFAKGRVALYAILRAMDIGPGDEVLVPGYTCVVVPSAIAYTGARPVYYDIDPGTYCGDAEQAAASITDRTRAVLIQHTYGMPSEDGGLIGRCRQDGIYVIEDCAHAMGGALNGRPLGTLGDAAFASFQWSKPVSLGLGGVARVNEENLLPAVRGQLTKNFSEPSLARSLSISALSWAYQTFMTPKLYWSARAAYHALGRTGWVAPSSTSGELTEPDVMPRGYCERFGRLRTHQLTRAIQRLPAAVEHSNAIARVYDHWFQGRAIRTQTYPPGASPMRLRFPVLVRDRNSLLESARRMRIELGDWFNAPLHPEIRHSPGLAYEAGMCPNAEHASQHVVNLPTHRRIDRNEADRILDFLADHQDLLLR